VKAFGASESSSLVPGRGVKVSANASVALLVKIRSLIKSSWYLTGVWENLNLVALTLPLSSKLISVTNYSPQIPYY